MGLLGRVVLVMLFANLALALLSHAPVVSQEIVEVKATYLINNTQNPSSLFDYQVMLVYDTALEIINNRMRPDCGDIRVYDSDGVTQLPFWIEPGTCGTTNTKIWVKVPVIPAGGTKNIYLKHGNPNLTSPGTPPNFVFEGVIGGLILAWDFEEGSGSVATDKSGLNNHGILYGNPQWVWVNNKVGWGIILDGEDDFVEKSSPSGFTSTEYTVVMWVSPLVTTSYYERPMPLTATRHSDKYPIYAEFYWSPDAPQAENRIHLIMGMAGPSSRDSLLSETALTTNTWHHVAMIYRSGMEMKIFINGNLDASKTTSQSFNPSDITIFRVGYLAGVGGAYIVVAETYVFSRTLSSSEIAGMYLNKPYATPNYPGFLLLTKFANPPPTVTLVEVEYGTETPTTTTATETGITVTLPPVQMLRLDRLVLYSRVAEPEKILITLTGFYTVNATEDLYPVNIRVYNENNVTLASIYYDPAEECFKFTQELPPEMSNLTTGNTSIQYGRWLVNVGNASVIHVRAYRYYPAADGGSGHFGTCPGDPITNDVLPGEYEFLGEMSLVMPPYYPFPEEIRPLINSLFVMLFIGMVVAFGLRGDIKLIGLGLIIFGGLVVPFLTYLGIFLPNMVLASLLLVMFGLLILWQSR